MIERHVGYLKDDDPARIHAGSLAILADVGLLVRNEKARLRFAEHGCTIDDERVTLPADVVERYLAMVPSSFRLYARDPAYDVVLPRSVPAITTASSAPNIVDPVSGEERWATSDDIARIAHLVNELDGIDVFSISVLADDALADQFSLSRFYPALKNCKKPCRTSVIDVREAAQVLKLGHLIAGSAEAFAERPFMTFGYCAIVSPLTMDFDSTEMLMYYAENGINAYGTVAPIAGLSTPLSLVGMLVQMNAEWLAAACLAQMSKPGTGQIYNFLPVMADMRSGAYAAGAIETGMVSSAVSQMARYYGVPAGGYLGLTNAKVSDAQAGFEKAMAPLMGALSGIDYIVMGGLMDALMSFDFGQCVIDNEIALMLKRAVLGFDIDGLDEALQQIRDVGPASMFVDHPHTLENMRSAAFLPDLADRTPRKQWIEDGGHPIHDRAMDKARAILTQDNLNTISAAADERVRAAFPNLIAGDSRPPEGWSPPQPARQRKRASRRRRTAQQT